MNTQNKGLIKGDNRIKDYILYSRGKINVPERFYDFKLVHKERPYDHAAIIKDGFHLTDINRIINRFDGISFEFLIN
jgi:hypothetical protein